MSKVYNYYKILWTPEYWRKYSERKDRVNLYRQSREIKLSTELLQVNEGSVVLEAGCGYGRISNFVVQKSIKSLVGIDISRQMVGHCNRNLPANFSGCVANIEKLPFKKETFDSVLCNGVLMHLENDINGLLELIRVLKRGGTLVISTNNLLSPFSLIMMFYTLLKRNYIQRFRNPWYYFKILVKNDCKILKSLPNTIFALSMRVPLVKHSFPPALFFPIYKMIDRFAENNCLRYFGYELWICAQKNK